MAHQVRMTIPPRQLKRADVVFDVSTEDGKYGSLNVSNGSVVWFPANHKYGFKMGWKKFDALMRAEAVRYEKRR